jgi:D-alanyl-D-alanine carboxypeptidase
MYKYATGGKTGYTPSAGKTLVTTSEKDNLKLTMVTLNDSNHYENHINIYNYIYDKYKSYLILDKNSFKVDLFTKDKVYIKKSFRYPLTEKEKEEIKTVVKINKTSGYKNNQKIGNVEIYLNEEKIGDVSIYVKKKKS